MSSIISINLAKFAMHIYPNEPVFDILKPHGEVQNHDVFLKLSDDERDQALLEIAKRHYNREIKYPFDRFYDYFNLSLSKLLCKKKVLDLGCAYGGSAVAYLSKWGISNIYGVDINRHFVRAADLLSVEHQVSDRCIFKISPAEELPFDNNFFDAIISFDVIEHVQSVEATISQCYRVLKPGGLLLLVFPSYYMPTEHHLGHVTRTPAIQWIFSSDTLVSAYDEIIQSRGEKNYWYYNRFEKGYEWAKLKGGIGINGTTINEFREIVDKFGFRVKKILSPPLFSVGQLSVKNEKTKFLSKLLTPFNKISMFQDFFSQRITTFIIK